MSFLRVSAAFGVVVRPQVTGVPLEVHRDALVVQDLTGQDQVLDLGRDAPYAAGPGLTPHRDEPEGLLANAQVLFISLTAFGRAHGLDPAQVVRAQKGLRGPVTAPVVPYVLLPLVLVQGRGHALADVAL